jgi:hypothetical protein
MEKTFINGFQSWKETFYEVTSYITSFVMSNQGEDSEIGRVHYSQGTTGLYQLAEEWADEFEQTNKKTDWEGADFWETIEAWLNVKNMPQ